MDRPVQRFLIRWLVCSLGLWIAAGFLSSSIMYASTGAIIGAGHLKDGKRLSVPLLISRGKSALFTVEPLIESKAAPTVAHPLADLIAEIAALADRSPRGRDGALADWAETHEGEHLRNATDLGGLELLRDDLKAAS